MIDLRTALEWHLEYNHYPPVPLYMIPICLGAIEAINEGDYERLISLPDGVTHVRYGESVPAYDIAEEFHLDGFVDDPGQEYEFGI